MSTAEVATVDQAAVEAILARQEQDEAGEVSYQTPILKVCQALTKEVKEGDAEAGEFFNTLTSESLGTQVEFVVAYFQRGRSASSSDGRYYVSVGEDLIPEHWADLVGEQFVGTPFSEYPDAEEKYKERVNNKEIEWGKGPIVSTTYNYTGHVLPTPEQIEAAKEAGEDEPQPQPVRISFLRSTKSAHDKLKTLKKGTMRNKAWWDNVFIFSTEVKSFGRNDSYVVKVAKDRETTELEKLLSVELATAVIAGRTQANDTANPEQRVEPDAAGGLGV